MTRLIFWFGLSILSFTGFVCGLIAIALLSLPDVGKLRSCLTTEMFQVSLCPGGPNYTRVKDISPHLIAAVLLSEDAAFYQHSGFDFDEIKDSLNKNLQQGTYARGGSTISQQLVKNVFLTQEKSLIRKVKEAFLTYELEKGFKKNEILERYLNVVQFGNNLFGVKSAAQYYFGKTPADLNILESGFLAALLPSPVKYSQSFKQKKLTPYMRGRVTTTAKKLKATGRISEVEYSHAMASVDLFPWAGLGNAQVSGEDILQSLEKTDFSKAEQEVFPESNILPEKEDAAPEEDLIVPEAE